MLPKTIGKVTATENKPTTYNTFRFWLTEDENIRIFDVVRVKHINKSYTYAIVRDLQYITDSSSHLSSYVSSDFGDLSATPMNQRIGTTIAEAEVLYNSGNIEMPVREGSEVQTADADGVREALGLIGYKNPIPAGYISMSYGTEIPIEFDSRYLIGPEGAHLNIAGISGLATKTSYAMFLMNSIQQKIKNGVSFILFNVKGKDLLAIDRPPAAQLNDKDEAEWKKCTLQAKPFTNVKYLYPFSNSKGERNYTISCGKQEIIKSQVEDRQAFNYYYDVETSLNKIRLLLSDIDDPNSTFEGIFEEIQNFDVKSWDAFKSEVENRARSGGKPNTKIPVISWKKFDRLIQNRTTSPIFCGAALTDSKEKRQVIISDFVRNIKPGEVYVIDIEPLPDYLQSLVVGDVVSTVTSMKLGEEGDTPLGQDHKIIIFADELNKFAPKTDTSGRALTNILLEVTERGRSLGIVLFGAEQFRSGVHDRIIGNCSTNIFGRTSPVEMSKCQDYRYFPDSYKASITRLEKGSLLLQHAVFKTHLIKVNFPFPCYYKEDTDR